MIRMRVVTTHNLPSSFAGFPVGLKNRQGLDRVPLSALPRRRDITRRDHLSNPYNAFLNHPQQNATALLRKCLHGMSFHGPHQFRRNLHHLAITRISPGSRTFPYNTYNARNACVACVAFLPGASMPAADKPNPSNRGIELSVNPAWEVHPTDIQQRLHNGEDLLLLDVRQPREWNAARLEGAVLIPLHELSSRAADELAAWKDRPIIVYCHHGVRSLNATAFLRKRNFANVHSLAGGIEAWSLIIDPNVPRY